VATGERLGGYNNERDSHGPPQLVRWCTKYTPSRKGDAAGSSVDDLDCRRPTHPGFWLLVRRDEALVVLSAAACYAPPVSLFFQPFGVRGLEPLERLFVLRLAAELAVCCELALQE